MAPQSVSMLSRPSRRLTLVAACIAVALACIAAPAQAAKKTPATPEQIVSALLADIDKRQADFEQAVAKLSADAEKRLSRAVTRLSLREVLKVDQTADRTASRNLRSLQKYIERGESKTLKALEKITDNPEHALTVRMAAAESIAAVQSAHNDLRMHVAERVNEAIDEIQRLLEEADQARL